MQCWLMHVYLHLIKIKVHGVVIKTGHFLLGIFNSIRNEILINIWNEIRHH